jgi:MtN3 and saliva related transmembrane protein
MYVVDLVGYTGTVVGTLVMLPQLVKTWRTRRVHDLSFWMLALYVVNCALWLVYGLLISARPVIVCNAIAIVISIVQVWMKLSFGRLHEIAGNRGR